jgi:hypothetical protein
MYKEKELLQQPGMLEDEIQVGLDMSKRTGDWRL